MSKTYSFWKKVFTDKNGEKQEKYYACPKTNNTITTEELADNISQATSLNAADVLSALRALSDQIVNGLQLGSNIKLDGIGTFGIGVSSPGYDKPEDINPREIKATKVCFIADKRLTKLIRTIKFVKQNKLPKGIVTTKGQ
ncbi:MAG: HU family DNA-binding protein [Bacteroidales bacterium]